MNNKSADTFANDGGRSLVGSDLKDCHNAVSNEIIKQIVETLKPNIYTIEKKGKKKLIYQAPWFKDGKYSGLVELSIELPENMPHFNRD
jgi:ribosomal protein S6